MKNDADDGAQQWALIDDAGDDDKHWDAMIT